MLQKVTGNNANKITAYYRANGRIITQQKYNVSQGNNYEYQNRPNGRQLFYGYDGLGSVAALSNHQGKLKTRYQYDAFGEVLAGDLSDNQYTFTGKRLDPESNLYHFHFRNYDAKAGVWTTADPIGVLGGVNLYQYVYSNPVNWIDWLGLSGRYANSDSKEDIACGGCHGDWESNYGIRNEYGRLASKTFHSYNPYTTVPAYVLDNAEDIEKFLRSAKKDFDDALQTAKVDKELENFFEDLDAKEFGGSGDGSDDNDISGGDDFGDRSSSPGGRGGV